MGELAKNEEKMMEDDKYGIFKRRFQMMTLIQMMKKI